MIKHLIIIEKTQAGYSAYSPDLGGCVATGRTKEIAEKTCVKQSSSILMDFAKKGTKFRNQEAITHFQRW
jgi:hypothetical protein